MSSSTRLCKTLVIDTADWAEQMCVEDLLPEIGREGIEDFGYGNGYMYVAGRVRALPEPS